MGYEDAPDGKECFDKIWSLSKISGVAGIIVGTHDVLMYTKPKGYVPTMACYLKTCVPMVASAATFAAVTCASCNFRQKDDKINYMIGGVSAGSIFGIATRSVQVGFPVAVLFAAVAALYKDSRDNGYKLFPNVQMTWGSFDHMNTDYSLGPKK